MEVLTRLRALPQQQQRKAAAILGALVADAVGTARDSNQGPLALIILICLYHQLLLFTGFTTSPR